MVGESGSGKTTLSRVIAYLNENADGQITLADEVLSLRGQQRHLRQRHKLQYIFQNPYKALNPAHTIGQTLIKVVQHFFGASRQEAIEKVTQVLKQVSTYTSSGTLSKRFIGWGATTSGDRASFIVPT